MKVDDIDKGLYGIVGEYVVVVVDVWIGVVGNLVVYFWVWMIGNLVGVDDVEYFVGFWVFVGVDCVV